MFSKLLILGIATLSQTAMAAETITYSYDAKGRVVRIVHSGSVNNGATTTYSHDKADNRVVVRATGGPT